jgi:hypothetical protein
MALSTIGMSNLFLNKHEGFTPAEAAPRDLSPLSLPLDYGGAQRQRSLLGVFGSEFQLVSA